MRRHLALLSLIGLMAIFCVSCAGGDRVPRQEPDARYGTYPSGSDVRYQRYGPQDRAGNPTQNNVPPYGSCQYATRC
jgi:hypothetical protein